MPDTESGGPSSPPVWLIWNPRWKAYQEHAEGLNAFGDPDAAYAELASLSVHAPGCEVVEMVPLSALLARAETTDRDWVLLRSLRRSLAAVVAGVGRWASDEDGVPDHLHADYVLARRLLAENPLEGSGSGGGADG